jgi:tRNA A37 threonylcarbamoyladenosine biosynthesis protein TsaE|tara:strand:- start:1262 stop:3382 length:2121 start_codon:yes stop_codon:yes gene_type:complete
MSDLLKFLKNSFEFPLTQSQINVAESLNEFFKGKQNCFILKGYAGTGKTTLLYGICQFLDENKVTYKLMAPTGRAAKVLSDKTMHNAYTIHKSIYSMDRLEEFKETKDDGSETFKYSFGLQNNDDPTDTVYIVDEASMVSDKKSEGEFFRFGSGQLLTDLFRYISFTSPKMSRKIIFVGDSAQLPPVNMNISPALDSVYIKEFDFNLTVEETEMVDVARHHKDSGILANATQLRTQIANDHFYKIKIETDYPETEPIDHGEIVNKYLEYADNEKEKMPIIIAATNKSVQRYNNAVRDRIYTGKSEVQPGDRLLVVRNNYKYDLLNGEFGKITDILTGTETIPLTLKKKTGEEKVELMFKSVTVEVSNMHGQKVQFDCKIIENLLDSRERDLTSDEQRALYVMFRMKMKEKGIKPNTNEFKEAIKNDRYFNALLIKYGYAVTCHKAQGGEWDTTIVDFSTSTKKLNGSYFRWCYTALTRSKNKMFCVDEPKIGIADRIKKINGNKTERTVVTKEEGKGKSEIEEKLPEHLVFQNDFQKELYRTVMLKLKNSITVNDIKHNQYAERYELETAPEKTTIDFIYNSKRYMTKIKLIKKGSGSDEICENLQELTASPICPGQKGSWQTNFPEGKPFLYDFYQEIKNKISKANIKISNVVHHQYLELYTFNKGSDFAVFKFHYKMNGEFTSFESDRKKSNSDDLINLILEKL